MTGMSNREGKDALHSDQYEQTFTFLSNYLCTRQPYILSGPLLGIISNACTYALSESDEHFAELYFLLLRCRSAANTPGHTTAGSQFHRFISMLREQRPDESMRLDELILSLSEPRIN